MQQHSSTSEEICCSPSNGSCQVIHLLGGGGALCSINILLIVVSDLKPSERPLSHRAHPGISTGSNGLKFCGTEMDGTSGKCQRLEGLTV